MSQPNNSSEILQAARQLLAQGQIDKALEYFQRGMEIDPSSKEIFEGAANAYFIKKDYDKAIQSFVRVTQLSPRDARAFINIGAVYNRKEDYQKAIEYLRRALSKNPTAAEAFYNLGIAYRGLNQLSMAISSYKEAVKHMPKMVEAYQNLGNIYRDTHQHDNAIEMYEKALDIKPDFDRARKGLETVRSEKTKRKELDNPFGRLVDPKHLKKRSERIIYRELNEQERDADRNKVKELTKNIEKYAEALMEFTKNILEPCLVSMQRAVIEAKSNRSSWNQRQEEFIQKVKEFQMLRQHLRNATLELRGHEEHINTPDLQESNS